MKIIQIVLLCLFFIPLSISLSFADDSDISAASHLQRGDRYLNNKQPFQALNEYEQAVLKGTRNPEIFRKLSLIHYDLGFLDESVSEMEKAVSLSPESELLRLDLGISYLAKGMIDHAEEQFMAVINKNPGLSNAYYYLGEIFYRKKEYGLAWLFEKRSKCLGHRGRELYKKLVSVSEEPKTDPCVYNGKDFYIRQILVDTENSAERVANRITDGELFEYIALDVDKNSYLNTGGYLGRFSSSELHPGITRELLKNNVFSLPVIVRTEAGFHILQRIAPFDLNEWKELLAIPAPSAISPHIANKTHYVNLSPGQAKQYLVYVGSYRQEEYAREAIDKLLRLGFSSYRYEKTTGLNEKLHIVVAGKFDSMEKAKKAGEDLAKNGFSFFIYRAN